MANADTKPVKLTSPKGAAIFPKLNEPDTKFKPEGSYETKLAFSADDPAVLAFRDRLNAIRDKYFDDLVAELTAAKKGAKARALKKVDRVTAETDDDSGDETGRLIFKATMKASGTYAKGPKVGQRWTRKPDIFDARGQLLKNPPRIGGGSELKLSIEVKPYLSEKDGEVGVACYLDAVQLIKLVSGGQRSFAEHGFSAEDGDEIDDGAAFGDETGGGGSGGGAADYDDV